MTRRGALACALASLLLLAAQAHDEWDASTRNFRIACLLLSIALASSMAVVSFSPAAWLRSSSLVRHPAAPTLLDGYLVLGCLLAWASPQLRVAYVASLPLALPVRLSIAGGGHGTGPVRARLLVIAMAGSLVLLVTGLHRPRGSTGLAWTVVWIAALLALRGGILRSPRAVLERVDALRRSPLGSGCFLGLLCLRLAGDRDHPLIGPLQSLWPIGLWGAWRLFAGDRPAGERLLRTAWWGTFSLALAMRLAFVVALPRPCWLSDSDEYLRACHELLEHGTWSPSERLTPGLSLTALACLATGGSYHWYLLVAHASVLAVAASIGGAVRRLFGPGAGLLVFAGLALSPHLLGLTHLLLAEWLVVLLLAPSSLLIARALSPAPARPVIALVAGLLGALAVLTKPDVLVVLLGFGLVALVAWRRTADRTKLLAFAVGALAPIAVWCGHNALLHGRFTLTSHGGPSLFIPASRYLVLDSPLHAGIKAELRPKIEVYLAQHPHPGWNVPDWNGLAPGGLSDVPSLERLPKAERDRVLDELAREALRAHPELFPRRLVYTFAGYLLVMGRDHELWTWEDTLRRGDPPTVYSLRPYVAATLGTPWVRRLEALSWRRRVYELGVLGPGRLLDAVLPFWALESPLTLIALAVLAWRARPRRLAVLALVLGGLFHVGLVCLVGNLEPRRSLLLIPLTLLAIASSARRSPTTTDPPGG